MTTNTYHIQQASNCPCLGQYRVHGVTTTLSLELEGLCGGLEGQGGRCGTHLVVLM